CGVLKPIFNFFCDLTCVDMLPSEPRFHVVYHLLSHALKERVRLKVKLAGDDPVVESIYPVWPACNFFEREVFDLFGVRFLGHPNLRRIMMPEDWEGNPLRKDYPVEGYRKMGNLSNVGSAECTADKTMSRIMGPQHPSTDVVLRLLREVDDDTVMRKVPDRGLL